MQFKPISYEDTKEHILNRHYAGRMPSIRFAYGMYDNNDLKGVLTFGQPASPSLCKGVAGDEYRDHVIELNRLYIDDDVDARLNLASQFIGYGLRQLKPLNMIVVSYSDSGMHHNGYVYQATNFYFTGATPQRTERYAGGKHSRHYDHDAVEIYRQLRTSKNRYIYIAGDKRFKRDVLRVMKYPILPYPKVDNTTYEVGKKLDVWLIDQRTHKTINLKDIKP